MNDTEYLRQVSVVLSRLQEQLAANVRPGHPDYISKADAAARLERIISDMQQQLSGNS